MVFLEELVFLMFVFFVNVEVGYWVVIVYDVGLDFVRLVFSVGKDGGGVGDNRRSIGGNYMILCGWIGGKI